MPYQPYQPSTAASDLRRQVERSLGVNLTKDEQFILANRLGWGDNRILSQDEIAVRLGVSQVTISNIEQTLRNKLRRSIRIRERNEAAAKAQVTALGTLYAAFEQTVRDLGLDMNPIQIAAARNAEPMDEPELES